MRRKRQHSGAAQVKLDVLCRDHASVPLIVVFGHTDGFKQVKGRGESYTPQECDAWSNYPETADEKILDQIELLGASGLLIPNWLPVDGR